jgi:hypothetical protein
MADESIPDFLTRIRIPADRRPPAPAPAAVAERQARPADPRVAEALRQGLLLHPFELMGPVIWVASLWTGGSALYLMALAALLIAAGGWLRGGRVAPVAWALLALWELCGCPFT